MSFLIQLVHMEEDGIFWTWELFRNTQNVTCDPLGELVKWHLISCSVIRFPSAMEPDEVTSSGIWTTLGKWFWPWRYRAGDLTWGGEQRPAVRKPCPDGRGGLLCRWCVERGGKPPHYQLHLGPWAVERVRGQNKMRGQGGAVGWEAGTGNVRGGQRGKEGGSQGAWVQMEGGSEELAGCCWLTKWMSPKRTAGPNPPQQWLRDKTSERRGREAT